MRSPLSASALLAMLLLAFSLVAGTGAGAQEATPEQIEPEDLEGLQHAVVRVYSIDYSAMLETVGTPGAELQIPPGIYILGATVLEFDNAENAESALFSLAEETRAQDEMNMSEEAVVTDLDLDLGDNNVAYSSVEEAEGVEAQTSVAFVQDDNVLYFIIAAGSDTDVQGTVIDLAGVLIENEGSGAGEFNEDGTSSGGLWDKFPETDDELIAGLIPYDQVLYPEPTGTPVA